MSKLAHSYQPTMDEIELRSAFENGIITPDAWARTSSLDDYATRFDQALRIVEHPCPTCGGNGLLHGCLDDVCETCDASGYDLDKF